jgi:hypothetical protein
MPDIRFIDGMILLFLQYSLSFSLAKVPFLAKICREGNFRSKAFLGTAKPSQG